MRVSGLQVQQCTQWRDSLDDGGRDHFAGPAPCGEAVEDDEGVLLLEGLGVVGLTNLRHQPIVS